MTELNDTIAAPYHQLEEIDGVKRYSCFQPTGMDPKGLGLPFRQHWYAVPLAITRDTDDPHQISNWEQFQEGLDEVDPDSYEIHRFGHWGPGWFEIILINPECTKALDAAYEMLCALSEYGVLNEEHASMLEREQFEQDIDNYLFGELERHMHLRMDIHFEDCIYDVCEDEVYKLAFNQAARWDDLNIQRVAAELIPLLEAREDVIIETDERLDRHIYLRRNDEDKS